MKEASLRYPRPVRVSAVSLSLCLCRFVCVCQCVAEQQRGSPRGKAATAEQQRHQQHQQQKSTDSLYRGRHLKFRDGTKVLAHLPGTIHEPSLASPAQAVPLISHIWGILIWRIGVAISTQVRGCQCAKAVLLDYSPFFAFSLGGCHRHSSKWGRRQEKPKRRP